LHHGKQDWSDPHQDCPHRWYVPWELSQEYLNHCKVIFSSIHFKLMGNKTDLASTRTVPTDGIRTLGTFTEIFRYCKVIFSTIHSKLMGNKTDPAPWLSHTWS
jgi:hypothetical protein